MPEAFEIFAANKQTGEEERFVVEANDANEAAEMANAVGLLVAEVRPPAGAAAAAAGPPPLPSPALPPPPRERLATSRGRASAAHLVLPVAGIVLIISVAGAVYCLVEMSGHDDRVQQIRDRAHQDWVKSVKRSPGANPPPMRYRVDSMSDGVRVTPEYIDPMPRVPPENPKVVAEKERQSNLRGGVGVAIFFALASLAAGVISILQLRWVAAGERK